MFTTPKNIIITAISLIVALFSITMALKPSSVDSQILTITHEIQNNQEAYQQAQAHITAAQQVVEQYVPLRDKAAATASQLRIQLIEITKGTGSAPSENNQLVDAGTSGKLQPTD